ncbi:LytR/AlgR family response regulator transcription factor [Mucilaginibacter sp. X5P1]|uniref:LytR/AlgR family response regulator transcription factor n=1 Tax=Mucilaginibacter sp. X5P1 TaxID=2723088 RepID=UPI00160D11FA|nr:LytTR family DNA-binding domain-containing protein [Mucilaginibacter sp. X5P1]MBB6136882.1 two-component system LytT family response regulator [Mucilaginibacter sp. X5P1]
MKVIIIEDEELAAERLTGMLMQLDPSLEVIDVIESVDDAVRRFSGGIQPDLVFMDIRLADGESFEIFDQVKINTPVIFVTAHDEHAIRAFQVNTIDYLLKPVEAAALEKALAKFHAYAPVTSNIIALLKSLNADSMAAEPRRNFKARFLVRSGDKFIPVSTNDVSYFSFENKLSFLHLANGTRYMADQTMDELEAALDPGLFFRLNRQYIVSFEAVKTVHNFFNGKLKVYLHALPEDGIMVSRYRANLLKEWLNR